MTEVVIDATGLACPQPIILLSQRISAVAVGESLTLLADDPAAIFDVAAWCRMTQQVLLSMENSTFVIKRTS
jgi:tRNA 2-thiouridine synthesizing protein A